MSPQTIDDGKLQVAALTALALGTVAALDASAFGPFELHSFEGRERMLATLADAGCDALIVSDDGSGGVRGIVADVSRDMAVLVVVPELGTAAVLEWLQRGAQEVLLRRDLLAASFPLRLRAAIERKRLEHAARTAYATDLDTGLPHQQQLIEHMSQLLALREREPAPMAVLALRIEGLATTEARLGREAANVLRRKLGVRLRAGVRASDVVASLADDSFAILLGSVLTPADATRVGDKLLKSLLEPFRIGGQDIAVATAIGIGQFPQDGSQPDALLRRAVGLASSATAQGRSGFANFDESGAALPGAANDD